ncbi:glycoside hydrolase family 2 protein [Azospirillum sp. TSO22-1]|uniref:glycoside hydrolase family 2 protein n=1 Tax=Azospirillum sp. TSO22-1 TaxID=716789 RepID=UPI000D61076A|nr:glycoside hydrolase family 2 protein [Azospirillum sp. TSO22-1]PWC42824.1 beta-mannosidase [Azospirillum sp. TSO22-1]
MARVLSVTGRNAGALDAGWELTLTAPGAAATPADLEDARDWIPAPVPGTVAQALRDAGRWSLDDPKPLHGHDVWYRTRLHAEGERTLVLHGLATLSEVWLNGERILASDSMFVAHAVPVRLTGNDELCLAFRALAPALSGKRGRARWRPRMIEHQALRGIRTTLLGHMPGWCPPVHAVGPWRPVELVEETGPLRVRAADLRSTVCDRDGTLTLTLSVDWRGASGASAWVEVAGIRAPLAWTDPHTLHGTVTVPDPELWWPHTHGKPALHAVKAGVGEAVVDLGRTGFRSIAREPGSRFALRVNGERVFCRGACWSTADIVSLPGSRAAYAPWLALMAEAGMNMLRVGGTMAYESPAFFELCDELGLLVWQDFMFANFDYPADEAFLGAARQEAAQLLDRVQASPSLAVLCGGSEAMQQAAMLGLPRSSWSQPLFDAALPEESARLRPDVPYLPNSPSGGALPFIANDGVTHYYGVGAYMRPLEDARRADVSFASECLAFANVPDAPMLAGVPAVHDPRWKQRVPRDIGAPWDFEDVREHYLRRLYGVDPPTLRYEDPDRHLRLSRAVTGDVMEAVFAEWRRAGSTTAGGLVFLFQDLWPGAGWGVVDASGTPKAAWHALKRAFRPVTVLLTDEGVNGLAAHLLNETAEPVPAVLSVACLRDGEVPVARGTREVTIPARGALALAVPALLDAFFDAAYAYRFGPPAHDATVATLSAPDGTPIAEAVHFPRPPERTDLDLTAEAVRDGDGWLLRLRSRRLARGVHVEDDGFRAADSWFPLPPGTERTVRLLPRHDRAAVPDGEVHALNGRGPVRFKGVA